MGLVRDLRAGHSAHEPLEQPAPLPPREAKR
jgi:hypothetical protein